MPWLILAVRSLAILAHAIWVGGFTFYGAVVLSVIRDEYGGLDAGRITQRVTEWLNAIGVGTVVLWWFVAWLERRRAPTLARRVRLGLLGATSILLAFLIVDHRVLDGRLDAYGLKGFYNYHRVYLIASTIQWAANLGLIPVVLVLWGHRPEESTTP